MSNAASLSGSHQVVRYEAGMRACWDAFIKESRNGTFLLQRDYMEYHSDRFSDYSLVITNGSEIVALLPANRNEDAVFSHQGLSYGGFIIGKAVMAPAMLEIFDSLLAYLRAENVKTLVYKTIPHIYHDVPTEEDLYALFRLDAALHSRTVLSVVDLARRLPLQERRRRGVKKARAANMMVAETQDWKSYWRLLEEQLAARHEVRPVHTLEEMLSLSAKFPGNIRLFTVTAAGELMGGTVIYETASVAHAQYIVSSPEGRDKGALDILYSTLMDSIFAHKRYFDFGISNEQNGRYLNVGLLEQKGGFGGRAVVHDVYSLTL